MTALAGVADINTNKETMNANIATVGILLNCIFIMNPLSSLE
jgi:hypothetical protein